MTDDGTTIELSWDWTTASGLPKIRYSIEPCLFFSYQGRVSNISAVNNFHDTVVANLPGVDFAWFDHFSTLIVKPPRMNEEIHLPSNSVIYAFDHINQSILAKAYYILRSEKQLNGSVDWKVIARAI